VACVSLRRDHVIPPKVKRKTRLPMLKVIKQLEMIMETRQRMDRLVLKVRDKALTRKKQLRQLNKIEDLIETDDFSF
jgi:hypothetical protein